MRESNFAFPAQNKACVCITSQLYDRRALDTTAPLPLFNSLTHLTYLTSTSPRIREIMTMDGGLERLVKILQDFCFSPPPPENPSLIYGLLPPTSRAPKAQPTLNPAFFDKHAAYRFSLAFQCVVNIGVRGSEQIRRRVVQAGTLDVVGCILEAWLASKGFAVGPGLSVTGAPRETREQRHARRLAAMEHRQREDAFALHRALQRTQREQMQSAQTHQTHSQPAHPSHAQPSPQQVQSQPSRHQQRHQPSSRLFDTQFAPSHSSQRMGRETTVAEEDEPMDSSPRPDRNLTITPATANSSRPSASTSASNSDTDLSTNASTAPTPLGSGTPTGVVVIPNRERSGTVIARPVWDNAPPPPATTTANATNYVAATPIAPQRNSNFSNSTIIVNGRGQGHTARLGTPSPSASTGTSRPDTETEDDGDGEVENEDVDMEDTTQSTQSSISATSIGSTSNIASTTVSASPSPERQATAPPPHRARLSFSRRAVGIVSENAPQAQTIPGIESGHHIIINEDLGDLGVGVGVNVGVEDGIVSLDQQATEDFAMGAPPGAPGAIDGTPRFTVGVVGRHGHGHHGGHRDPPPDVTPRATVTGLPRETPSPPASRMASMRGRSGTAPEPHTEPLLSAPGPSNGGALGLNHRTTSGTGAVVIPPPGQSPAGRATSVDPSPSAPPPSTGGTNPSHYTTTTNANPISSPGPITATNTISSTASTSSATTAPNTPTSYPGPYRDEDVLLGLQLLAYLSKYPHVRQAFYKPRQSFHPATLVHQQQQQQQQHHGSGMTVGSASAKGKAPMIPPPTQKDGSYFKTFNGSSVMAHNTLPPPGVTNAGRSGKERAPANVSSNSATGSNSASVSPNSNVPGGIGGGTGRDRLTNVFSLVERFTFKPSSSELAANGGSVPRLPPEIQYWAGVVMRNACRKDDNQGGIRQCANMLCGRWEAYPREFAKCRRCRKAKYCGKECQSTAWSEGHRFWCSAKDVEDENTAGNHGHGHHGSNAHGGEGNQEGDEEDAGGRRERRERRERERERREDGAETATQVPRVSRRTAHGGHGGEAPGFIPPLPSSPVEGRRRAETITGAGTDGRASAAASASHDMVLG